MRTPIRKCTVKEICTSKGMDMPCDRWISDEECVDTLARLIYKEILSLEEMKALLFYQDYCKVRN